jgi:hypothetical protein
MLQGNGLLVQSAWRFHVLHAMLDELLGAVEFGTDLHL